MATSAFGVEDPRISKSDKDFNRKAAEITGAGVTGAAAPVLGAMAVNAHRRQKSGLRAANSFMEDQWRALKTGYPRAAASHQGMAQVALDEARKARKLKYVHGGAGLAAGAAGGTLATMAYRNHKNQ
jgi:hypothetical protein